MFYAEQLVYGKSTHPESTVYAFHTKAERDKWVKEHDDDEYHRAFARKASDLSHGVRAYAEVLGEE